VAKFIAASGRRQKLLQAISGRSRRFTSLAMSVTTVKKEVRDNGYAECEINKR